eukprot:5906238-Lingulodinium_polyedra.AAC.1
MPYPPRGPRLRLGLTLPWPCTRPSATGCVSWGSGGACWSPAGGSRATPRASWRGWCPRGGRHPLGLRPE